jgi:uncharacterized LabA/DUF88 family protein
VAVDGDYVPTVEKMRKRGLEVYLVFWDHASGELKRACTKFVSLNPHIEMLRLK